MDNYQAARDLTDVVLAGASSVSNIVPLPSTSTTSGPRGFVSISTDNNIAALGEGLGDLYSNTGDPLLRDRTMLVSPTEHHDEGKPSAFRLQNGSNDDVGIGPTSSSGLMFSRMLQITTCDPSPIATPEGVPLLGGIKCTGDLNYANCPSSLASTKMVECSTGGMMQNSSPRNLGMKRRGYSYFRKSQAMKVVCISAPADSRPSSGEVVPSDLWAWRKYGQKPIKGFPYPRGYYRCSSSKGCLARKQVERSRADPKMLVITYTSEHNHSWPTHRNSLAGSTRSTSKGGSISKSSVNSNNSHPPKPRVSKCGEPTGNSSGDNMSSSIAIPGGALGATMLVTEEMEEVDEKKFEVEDVEFLADGLARCYQPSMMEGPDRRPDDFFADLGELDADPYELLFDQGFTGNYLSNWANISSDTFNLLDWEYEDDGASFGEVTKKGLRRNCPWACHKPFRGLIYRFLSSVRNRLLVFF